jgi:hypothetical protein
LSDETTEQLAKEAAFFASEQSRQVHDFIDYFYIYINLAQKETSRANQSTEKRMSDVESILQTILAELFDFLDCPQVKSLPAPEHVMKAVMDWLSSGKMLGFSRLSSGARQIIVTPEFQSEPVDIPRAVRDYVMDANQFFSRKHNLIPIMTQDGSTCCYYANDAGKKGQLLLNPEKVISLYSYQSVSSPPETLA